MICIARQVSIITDGQFVVLVIAGMMIIMMVIVVFVAVSVAVRV